MAVRPLLRRAPRRAVCMLWLLVALRLLLPARLTVESPVSLQQPESPPIQAYQELRQQEKVYVSAPPEQRLEMAGPAAAQGFALLDQLPAIWLTGVGCMALYMALSLLRMRWRLRAAPAYRTMSIAAPTGPRPSCWACSRPAFMCRKPCRSRTFPRCSPTKGAISAAGTMCGNRWRFCCWRSIGSIRSSGRRMSCWAATWSAPVMKWC